MPRDRDWLIPSAVLTALLALATLSLIPLVRLNHPATMLWSLAGWFFWASAALGASITFYTVRMMRAGNEHPISTLLATKADLKLVPIIAGITLAGIDLFFFMWLKPELNAVFPFWADPLLAWADHATFGVEPWHLFTWLNIDLMAAVYGILWFVAVQLTFYWLMLKPPSREKTIAVISYFLCWSVFGPVGQALFPAAGPIFYDRLGYGSRFADLPSVELVGAISSYLWAHYQMNSAGVGVGISAMPSLHIASMAWAVLSFATFRSKITVPAVALALYMWAGSILLGWHYFTDGVVGIIGAGGCFFLATLWAKLARRSRQDQEIPQLSLSAAQFATRSD